MLWYCRLKTHGRAYHICTVSAGDFLEAALSIGPGDLVLFFFVYIPSAEELEKQNVIGKKESIIRNAVGN